MSREDSRPRLGEIDVPTLVVWGAEDGITSCAHQDEIVSLIDGSRLAVIPGAGHLVTIEAPDAVMPLLDAFLDA